MEPDEYPKEGVIVYKHFRYVDEIWRAQQLEAVLERVDAIRLANDREEEFNCLSELEAEVYGLSDLAILQGLKVIAVEDGNGDECHKLVRAGPFPYSRGTHLLPDGETEEKNSPWKPDPVGGETVAAVLVDGVSFCVIEPCIAPDAYRYERGRTIAEGRLLAGLSEMGIVLPK